MRKVALQGLHRKRHLVPEVSRLRGVRVVGPEHVRDGRAEDGHMRNPARVQRRVQRTPEPRGPHQRLARVQLEPERPAELLVELHCACRMLRVYMDDDVVHVPDNKGLGVKRAQGCEQGLQQPLSHGDREERRRKRATLVDAPLCAHRVGTAGVVAPPVRRGVGAERLGDCG